MNKNNVNSGVIRRALTVLVTIFAVIAFVGCGVQTVIDILEEGRPADEVIEDVQGATMDDVQTEVLVPEDVIDDPAQELDPEPNLEIPEDMLEEVIPEDTEEEVIPEDVEEVEPEDVETSMPEVLTPEMDLSDAVMLAKLVYGESRGIYSVTEQACVIWTVLNRVDATPGSTIYSIVTAPNQFHYSSAFPTVDDYRRDLVALAEDVLIRWYREKAGETDVGRVLPPEYKWYGGDGVAHNYFRDAYQSPFNYWDYSLVSPYAN